MVGISVKKTIGIGDAVQFTSLPENYFRATKQKLVDIASHWIFDHNPYVLRGVNRLDRIFELWNYRPEPTPREGVYLSLAERYTHILNVPCIMNRPRLYKFEEPIPFQSRKLILLHVQGVSHGILPGNIIKHVIQKYGGNDLYQFGLPSEPEVGLPRIHPKDLWDAARIISQARMFIGPDSGPSWIAACYPDVLTKIVRTKPTLEHFKNWVPLSARNIHSHWDDRSRLIYNPSDDDHGFTWSYRRI